MVLPPMMALGRVRRCLPAAAAAREVRAGGRPSHRIQQMGRRQRPQASPKACLWHRLDSEPSFVSRTSQGACVQVQRKWQLPAHVFRRFLLVYRWNSKPFCQPAATAWQRQQEAARWRLMGCRRICHMDGCCHTCATCSQAAPAGGCGTGACRCGSAAWSAATCGGCRRRAARTSPSSRQCRQGPAGAPIA